MRFSVLQKLEVIIFNNHQCFLLSFPCFYCFSHFCYLHKVLALPMTNVWHSEKMRSQTHYLTYVMQCLGDYTDMCSLLWNALKRSSGDGWIEKLNEYICDKARIVKTWKRKQETLVIIKDDHLQFLKYRKPHTNLVSLCKLLQRVI